jgi:argininosuccinate lyase
MATSEGEEKKETKLWGGRFEEGVTDAVERFTESISYDWQLYKYDIMGSKAHASMLAAQVPYVRSTMVVLGPSSFWTKQFSA